jgi:hypothetical protein
MNNEALKHIFVDGINNINFINGMVRINMGIVVPGETQEEQPTFKETHQIIVPLNSFLNAFESQKQLIEQLEKNGIISKTDGTSPAGNQDVIIPDVVK